ASQIDEIPGIGPVRRKALLKHLGSLHNIQSATEEQLAEVAGISEVLAGNIHDHFEMLRLVKEQEQEKADSGG
ncbi:MAG: hypothetical protein J7M39_10365, partial [Anaerolineae bacterium]|nr:hypothetical protein [Anaerolineae bacterium]